jgi:hypothetical protein
MPTLGTCPVCERAIRVRTGKMVHHGYERPGHGHIVGSCYGLGAAPYEVSSEGTRSYRDHVVAPRLARDETFLARLEANTVEELHYEATVPVPMTLSRGRSERGSDPGWTTTVARVRFDEIDPERQRLWDRVHRARLETTRSEVAWMQREVERVERLIRDWAPGELREIDADPQPGRQRRRRRLFRRMR